MFRSAILGLACLVLLSPRLVLAKAPKLADVRIYPAEINLKTKQDQQSLVPYPQRAEGPANRGLPLSCQHLGVAGW